MSRKKITEVLKIILQIAPIIMIIIMAILYFVLFKDVTVDKIVHFTPPNKPLAILVILCLFALKSLSFFFPMLAIIVASGSMFPVWIALPVNILGVLIQITIPYVFGHYVEREFVQKLVAKHKSLEKIDTFTSNNEFFVSFFLRVINITPCDVVSLLLGSMNISYIKYITGSILGILPGLIFATIIGNSLSDPTSPMFIVSVCGDIVISVCSLIIYYFHNKNKKKKSKE